MGGLVWGGQFLPRDASGDRLLEAAGDRLWGCWGLLRLLGTGCVVGTDSWARAWGWLTRDQACARRKAQEGEVFALRARGLGCLPSMLAPARSRWRCWGAWVISASGDRLLGTGCVVGTDSWARAWGWLARDQACARRKAQGGEVFALRARGLGCLPSMLAPARSR
jgi:hypothetical protein